MSKVILPQRFRSICLLLSAFLLGSTLAPAAETVTVPSIWPRGSIWHKQLSDAGRDIERATRGRVEIRLYDQAVLEYVPELGVYSLPLVFRNDKELAYVRSKMDSRLLEIIRSKGLIPLTMEGVGAGHIFTTSPQINTLEAFQQSQLWIPRGKGSDAFEAFGIKNPVPASLVEVKPKMALGKLDTFVATPSTVILARWPYGTTPLPTPSISLVSSKPIMHFVAPLALYAQGYGKLSAEDQEVTRTILIKAFQEASKSNRDKDAEAIQILKRRPGVEFQDFVDPTASNWSSWSDSVINKLVSEGKVPSSLVSELRGHLQSYRGG